MDIPEKYAAPRRRMSDDEEATGKTVGPGGALDGQPVLPGFRLELDALFSLDQAPSCKSFYTAIRPRTFLPITLPDLLL